MPLIESLISRVPVQFAEQFASLGRSFPLVGRLRKQLIASLKSRDGVVASGPAQGLRFNPGESDSRFLLGNFEPALQDFLGGFLKPGMTFLDVGANVGFLSLLGARMVTPAGAVHAFEPLPQNAVQIRYNCRLNNFSQIAVHELALSNEDSEASFRMSERPTFGALSDSPIDVDEEIGTIRVPVRRLDALWEAKLFARPDLIKIDIEGSEVDFLAGSRRVLDECRPVLLLELHGTNAPVAAALRQANYRAFIVGGGGIEAAPWAALAIAVPSENTAVRNFAQDICARYRGR